MRLSGNKKQNRLTSFALRLILFALLIAVVTSTASRAERSPSLRSKEEKHTVYWPRPSQAPDLRLSRWLGLIGEYGPDNDIVIILEKDEDFGAVAQTSWARSRSTKSPETFQVPRTGTSRSPTAYFERNSQRARDQVAVNAVILSAGKSSRERKQLRVKPVRPVPELMKDALAAQPPRENGEFRRRNW